MEQIFGFEPKWVGSIPTLPARFNVKDKKYKMKKNFAVLADVVIACGWSPQEVGSIPTDSTKIKGFVAQLVEQQTENLCVGSSILPKSTKINVSK